MHATIRLYESVTSTTEECERLGRQTATCLGQAPGFVSYVLLENGRDVLATISFFEDRASLEDADRAVEAAIAQKSGASSAEPSRIISGEVLFQRGM
jgi:hypothetical protein